MPDLLSGRGGYDLICLGVADNYDLVGEKLKALGEILN
jgi:hypothetical protein